MHLALGEKEIPILIKSMEGSMTCGALELWFNFVTVSKLRRDQRVLRWIAFDTLYKPGENDTIIKQWAVKGMKAVCTIMDNKEKQTSQTFNENVSPHNWDLFRVSFIYLHKILRLPQHGSEERELTRNKYKICAMS